MAIAVKRNLGTGGHTTAARFSRTQRFADQRHLCVPSSGHCAARLNSLPNNSALG